MRLDDRQVRRQLNPNLSQLNLNLSQLNPNLSQHNPDLSQLNPNRYGDKFSSSIREAEVHEKDRVILEKIRAKEKKIQNMQEENRRIYMKEGGQETGLTAGQQAAVSRNDQNIEKLKEELLELQGRILQNNDMRGGRQHTCFSCITFLQRTCFSFPAFARPTSFLLRLPLSLPRLHMTFLSLSLPPLRTSGSAASVARAKKKEVPFILPQAKWPHP